MLLFSRAKLSVLSIFEGSNQQKVAMMQQENKAYQQPELLITFEANSILPCQQKDTGLVICYCSRSTNQTLILVIFVATDCSLCVAAASTWFNVCSQTDPLYQDPIYNNWAWPKAAQPYQCHSKQEDVEATARQQQNMTAYTEIRINANNFSSSIRSWPHFKTNNTESTLDWRDIFTQLLTHFGESLLCKVAHVLYLTPWQ